MARQRRVILIDMLAGKSTNRNGATIVSYRVLNASELTTPRGVRLMSRQTSTTN